MADDTIADHSLIGLFVKEDELQQKQVNGEHHYTAPLPAPPLQYNKETGKHGHGNEEGAGIMDKIDDSKSEEDHNQYHHEEGDEREKRYMDKIKEQKNEEYHYHGMEGEKKLGLMDKFKQKLHGHKKEGDF